MGFRKPAHAQEDSTVDQPTGGGRPPTNGNGRQEPSGTSTDETDTRSRNNSKDGETQRDGPPAGGRTPPGQRKVSERGRKSVARNHYRDQNPPAAVTTSHAMTEAQQGEGPAAASATSSATSNSANETSSVSSVAAERSASASSDVAAVSVGPNGVAAASPAGAVGVGPDGGAAASNDANATTAETTPDSDESTAGADSSR